MPQSSMFAKTEDIRIHHTKVVLPPAFLEEELPGCEKALTTVYNARSEVKQILSGESHRLLVVVGPCSIHDTKAALEYATLLKPAMDEFSQDLRIVMRVYFEKPRTTVGWKGLINDPHLDGSYRINDGLRLARHLLLDLAEMGVPAGTEFLDMISRNTSPLWSVGARSARAPPRARCIASSSRGLSARSASRTEPRATCRLRLRRSISAAHPHTFLGHTKYGPVRDLLHHRKSRLPRDPARRPADDELRRCRRWRRHAR